MREVKFRIYDKQEKKFLIKNQKIKNGDIKSILNEIIDLEECSVQINNPEENRYEFLQSTGIKDMNGKEIYEGDIIQRRDYKFKIIWDETRFIGIGVSPMTGENLLCCIDSFDKFGKNYVEVIGNIYENPELLGEGK